MIVAHFRFLNPECKYKLFKCYCMPLYGVQLLDLDCKYSKHLNVSWRKAIRRLFNLPYTTHCALLPHICKDISIESQLYSRIVNFLKCLWSSKNQLVNLCYKLCILGSLSPTSNNISYLSFVHNVSREEAYTIKFPRAIDDDEEAARTAQFILDLLNVLNDRTITPELREDFVDILHYLCTS